MCRRRFTKCLGFAVFVIGLSACGGGGGASNDPAPSPAPTPSNPSPSPVPPANYTIGGTLSGLAAGKSVTLQNNGADNLTLTANGGFVFSTAIAGGVAYDVTVLTQPAGETCIVTNGSGTAGVANVTNVSVTCVPIMRTIGGSLSGLSAGNSIVLQNNGTNNLMLSTNGSFTFSVAIASGAAYNVTILTQPTGQTCTATNGSGAVGSANVTNVLVGCAVDVPAAPNPTLGYGIKQLRFSWPAVAGATFYRLFENPDGVSGYTQVSGDLTVTSINHDITLFRRLNARYIIAACNSAGCTNSPALSPAANLVPAIGYVKASNTGTRDQFGYALAISADGNTLAVGASGTSDSGGEDSAATGIDGSQVADCNTGVNCADDAGAVYVFIRLSTGTWSQQAYVKASNTGRRDSFGISLSLSADGNTLAVGASGEDSSVRGVIAGNPSDTTVGNTFSNSGAVYVYTRNGTVWTQQAYVKSSYAWADDAFGWSLALSADGNTLAVGAYGEDSAATGIGGNRVNGCGVVAAPTNCARESGAVYVYTRSGSVWSSQPVYMKASNTGASDLFGQALALSADGNTLAVGAYNEDSNITGIIAGSPNEATVGNTFSESGAVYVFIRSNTGTWTQQAYVKSSNTDFSDHFGYALALSADGNTLAVGARGEDSNITGIIAGSPVEATVGDAVAASGAVYVFTRGGTAWAQQVYVKASNTGASDLFGQALALSGDGNTLAVVATGENSDATGISGNQADDSATGAGAVYVFTRFVGPPVIWSQRAYVKAANTEAIDSFGRALALSFDGSTLFVGAIGEDSAATGIGGNQVDDCSASTPTNCAASSGAVYLY